MKKALFFFMFVLANILGCGTTGSNNNETEQTSKDSLTYDDTTIYGLACDGCNDTIVVFLTLDYDGSDPDTLNVLDATRQHMVFGDIRIGDKLAIVRNEQDSTKARMVVVIEDLMGEWCQQVLPTLRDRADMEGLTQKQKEEQLPDSIRELLNIPLEYTYVFKHDNILYTKGANRQNTSDEILPVEYPILKRYREWNFHNGQIILVESMTDSLGMTNLVSADTVDLMLLTADSLVLRFNDGPRGFYKKIEE
jgi:hypothetical protein